MVENRRSVLHSRANSALSSDLKLKLKFEFRKLVFKASDTCNLSKKVTLVQPKNSDQKARFCAILTVLTQNQFKQSI